MEENLTLDDPRDLDELEHGTRRAYIHGRCRCDDCRAAQSDYRRGADRLPGLSRVELEQLAIPGDWILQARCVGAPVTVFFPAPKEDPRDAKRICAGCPVMSDCRAYALQAPAALDGVWGGLTQAERFDERRKRKDGWL